MPELTRRTKLRFPSALLLLSLSVVLTVWAAPDILQAAEQGSSSGGLTSTVSELPDFDYIATLELTDSAQDPQKVAGGADAALKSSDFQPATPIYAPARTPAPEPTDIATITEPLKLDNKTSSVVGVSWKVTSEKVAVDVRTKQNDNDEWSPWQEASLELAAEGYFEEGKTEDLRDGTVPLIYSNVAWVQARVVTESGVLPKETELSTFIAGEKPDPVSEAESASELETSFYPLTPRPTTRNSLVSAADTSSIKPQVASFSPVKTSNIIAPKPNINLRSSWKAASPKPTLSQATVKGITIHHTAGSNSYAKAEVPGIIRGIQSYHMGTRGWDDIGYNFLIDKYGGIWEGRAGGIEKATQGAHASSFNQHTSGFSVLGNYDNVQLPTAARDSVIKLAAWKLAIHGVRADGTMNVLNVKTNKYQNFPTIVGHKDVPDASTACPGRYFYPLLSSIRTQASSLQKMVATPLPPAPKFPPASPQPQAKKQFADYHSPYVVAASGALSATVISQEHFGAPFRVADGFKNVSAASSGPSLKKGGFEDILVRVKGSGETVVKHLSKRGQISGSTSYGYNWSANDEVLLAGDWDSDGNADVIAIDQSSGVAWLHPGNGSGGFGTRVQINQGWNSLSSVISVSDLTGDGFRDIVALHNPTGEIRIYPGNGKGGFKPVISLGNGYKDVVNLASVGDISGDKLPDIIAKRSNGSLITIRLNSSGNKHSEISWGHQTPFSPDQILLSINNFLPGKANVIAINTNTGVANSYPISYGFRGKTVAATGSTSLVSTTPLFRVVVGKVDASATSAVEVDTAGIAYLIGIDSEGSVIARKQIGSGLNGLTSLAGGSDIDSDGVPDLVGVHKDGRVILYPFNKNLSGTLATSKVLATGMANQRVIPLTHWGTETNFRSLLFINQTGDLSRYRVESGTASLKFSGIVANSGWSGFNSVVSVGDIDGDGYPDLLAKEQSSSKIWLYRTDAKGRLLPRVEVTGTLSTVSKIG